MGPLEVSEKQVVYVYVFMCVLEGLRHHCLVFHWWPGAKWNRTACHLAFGPLSHSILLHAPSINPYDTLINPATFLFDWEGIFCR